MATIKDGVQKVVNKLYQKNKEVSASDLVNAAKSKQSPAHNAFEWDNKKAGDEYRLWQARAWLRKVTIVIENREEKLVHVQQIIIDGQGGEEEEEPKNTTREGCYKPISIVSQNQHEFDLALAEIKSKLVGLQIAYDTLKRAAEKYKKVTINFKKIEKGFNMFTEAIPN